LQRTAAAPLAGTRREPAELSAGEGVLPTPPLPLKPTVSRGRSIAGRIKGIPIKGLVGRCNNVGVEPQAGKRRVLAGGEESG